MAEADLTSVRSPTLESLQNRSRDMRRIRPPDIAVLRSENRVPLRPERLAKRESRIGLRSLFGKSKTRKEDKAEEERMSLREVPRHGGIRNSLADIGNWPQRLQASRSEISLSRSATPLLVSPASEDSFRSRQGNNGAGKGKLRQQADSKTKGPSTAFDLPPLFQMYPQAIKYATLPACVASIEALARFSESKSRLLRNDSSQSDLTLDQGEMSKFERTGEADKKKKSKFAPEWTTKVYALVTSGYLLQYTAEGRFDRLPEKILQLTRDSAAYASDLIPGRHWVVRVTSSTDAEGNPSSDTKSFKSKLALRGIEKRQVSNMLLVFESPDAMDAWLAMLRREIELLGGKKKLSETGKPEADDDAVTLKAQASQRTLVTRDPDRFSRIVSQDFSWTQENALADPTEEPEFSDPPLERMSESTVDDGSSMVSSDGQRLDSLRDSGSGSSGNRLSFISSGQRTILSSAESSPTHSPNRSSFSSHLDDFPQQVSKSTSPPTPEVRPRPNAAAIMTRRQSMQMMIPGFDTRLDASGRPFPALPISLTSSHEKKQQSVPNFSVPHTVGRRFSAMNLSNLTSGDQPPLLEREGPARPLRRSPPTTLAISRPLSIVLDQPSPMSPSLPAVSINRIPNTEVPDPPSMFGLWGGGNIPRTTPQGRIGIPDPHVAKHNTEVPQPRNNSINPWGVGQDYSRAGQLDLPRMHVETERSRLVISPTRARPGNPLGAPELIRRAASSLEMRRYQSYEHTILPAENLNFLSQNRHSLIYPKQSSKVPSIEEPSSSYTLAPPLTCSPKRSAPSLKTLHEEAEATGFLAVDMRPKTLMTRRSMPHLADGPPPAPPPTCALPPIPRKRSANTSRSIKA
ncbi:hypothetical protein GGR54DRAFT_336952 [Hypoxylon sp. NC1633]|nr:hypothetical protein GGR54DRAFT_336952 [Hypoxylon sp. NC1633]